MSAPKTDICKAATSEPWDRSERCRLPDIDGELHYKMWYPVLGETSDGTGSMRDWLLVLLPILIALYFIIFPDQFNVALNWLHGIIFQN